MSMVVVGGTSLVGAALHWWKGNFHTKAALLFAATGVFGADMAVELVNDGPVTLLLESAPGA